jgi:hypothetical protein
MLKPARIIPGRLFCFMLPGQNGQVYGNTIRKSRLGLIKFRQESFFPAGHLSHKAVCFQK